MLNDSVDLRRRLAAVALGEVPADLVVRGGIVVDVYSGLTHRADVAVSGDRIAAVGDVGYAIGDATTVIEADGQYVVPGLIDTHIHVGGSQTPPTQLAQLLIPHGTAAIGTCFYEAAAIAGVGAVRTFLDEAATTPLHILLSVFHSCYAGMGPAGNPGRVSAEDLLGLLDLPEAIEIREWSVFNEKAPDDVFRAYVDRARERGLIVAGHLEGQTGRPLQASVALGAHSDHEMGTAAEAMEKLRLGVRIQARQGAAAWDLHNVLRAVTEMGADSRYFMFATDEQEAHHLAEHGHIDDLVRMAIGMGIDPVDAVRMGSQNAAEYLGLTDHLGAVAPGRLAHLLLVDNLREFTVQRVVADGRLAAEDGRYLAPVTPVDYPAEWRETVHVASISPASFVIDAPGDEPVDVRVIGITPGSLLTDERRITMTPYDGQLRADPSRDLAKLCVIDRHGASGRVGRAFTQGTGLSVGAVATTVNPGLQNLMVLGVDDADMDLAARRLAELGGGIVVAIGGEVAAEVALPLLGIFSDGPVEDTVAAMAAVERALLDKMDASMPGLLAAVGFATLAVSIPALKVCDQGLVSVRRDSSEFVPLLYG
ncbi:MAG TPA: adenine deaminase C-terminal domain-containing protein [Actinomycetes bacterium]|nr:adenine deaminase C-terminal domain-containing protein [Actinomycetes bacterium]